MSTRSSGAVVEILGKRPRKEFFHTNIWLFLHERVLSTLFFAVHSSKAVLHVPAREMIALAVIDKCTEAKIENSKEGERGKSIMIDYSSVAPMWQRKRDFWVIRLHAICRSVRCENWIKYISLWFDVRVQNDDVYRCWKCGELSLNGNFSHSRYSRDKGEQGSTFQWSVVYQLKRNNTFYSVAESIENEIIFHTECFLLYANVIGWKAAYYTSIYSQNRSEFLRLQIERNFPPQSNWRKASFTRQIDFPSSCWQVFLCSLSLYPHNRIIGNERRVIPHFIPCNCQLDPFLDLMMLMGWSRRREGMKTLSGFDKKVSHSQPLRVCKLKSSHLEERV